MRPLSEVVEAAASVAIAFYLVGLVLSIAGNSVSGSSAIVRTIKGQLFSPWMGPAWLDLGFDHPLTYGMPEDADHQLEIRSFDGGQPVRLPGSRRGEQAARWRRLARRIASAPLDDDAVPLAAAVGRGSFAITESEDVVVEVLRRPLEDVAMPEAPKRFERPYQSRVRRVAGEIQLIELGGEAKRSELAPVLRDAAAQPAADDTDDGADKTP